MTEDRRRHSKALPHERKRIEPLGDSAKRSAAGPSQPHLRGRQVAPEHSRALYCEIEGLPAKLEEAELSSAGVFVLTAHALPVDSEVSMFVRIDEQRFPMTGHVVTSVSCELAAQSGKRPGYALLFTNLSDIDRKRLTQAIARYRATSSPQTVPKHALPVKPATSYPAAELALLEQLRVELNQLAGKPPWAVLGVSQGADRAAVKAAFFQASKRYHPHLFARYSHPEINRVVTELFIAHKRAYTSMARANKSSMRASRP